MGKPKYCAVLWDYDDTLALTEVIALGAAYDYLVEYLHHSFQIEVNHSKAEHIDRFAGVTFVEIINQLSSEQNFTIAPEELRVLAETEVERVLLALGTELKAMPGSIQVLKRCRELNITSAVVSSSATKRLHACLDCTGQNVFVPRSLVFSASDSMEIPQSKPNPAIYLFAIKQLKLSPLSVLAVEDSVSGVKSAVAAGIDCLGFTGAIQAESSKILRAEQLRALGAFDVIDDLHQVERFLTCSS